MAALLPPDPIGFVARAEQATNARDVDWAMTVYSSTITLETFGDGVHEVYEGADAVRGAVSTIYGWLAAMDGRISKTLIAASDDALVNQWEGSLYGGRRRTYGAEFWIFDEKGLVTRNVLYQSLDPKPLTSPLTGLRNLVSHPRPALSYLTARARARRHRQHADSPSVTE